MEGSSALHPSNPHLGTQIIKWETYVSTSSKRGENWVHVQACCRQVFSSLGFYGKGDSSLHHLKEKTFTVSFCEKTSLVCTLAILMLTGTRDWLENPQG